MKRILFGHRGVGKSSLLKRHQEYFPDILHYDLDEEVANHASQSVSEFFAAHGEAEFRKLEQEIFQRIIQKDSFVIAVGGGFDVSMIPEVFERIYVSRRTDKEGRIFLGRPRLNPELDSLSEYKYRYTQREPAFLKYSDWVYEMPEAAFTNDIEKKIFTQGFADTDAYVTLQPAHLKILDKFKRVELRTDLFSNSAIFEILKNNNEFLVSIRNEKGKSLVQELKGRYSLDWAVEQGVPAHEDLKYISVISTHADTISAAIKDLSDYKKIHLKLCPVVRTWEELQEGYNWQRQDPELRSFLPRTDALYEANSVWRWFREYILPFQKLNYISQYAKIHDQPSLYEIYQRGVQEKTIFSAILGWPIEHSRTPAIHTNYFNHYTFAIPVDEMNFAVATEFLISLGLRTAAVTSPLKKLASELTGVVGCNSIYFAKKWVGKNTDIIAIDFLCQDYLSTTDQVAVWGGGGVIEQMQMDYPQFAFYSSREGQLRDNVNKISSPNPTVVMWGAPRNENTKMPPADWSPRLVIDFNYHENSMGLEYALNLKNRSTYVSGLEMYRLQAAEQIKFFKAFLEREDRP